MVLLLKLTRFLGLGFAICVSFWLLWMLRVGLRNFGFTSHFAWHQLLPVYLPYFVLLLLLAVPFSRIKDLRVWKTLLCAMFALTLWWFVPIAYRAAVHPRVHVEKPPGDGIAPHILIRHSYEELLWTTVVFGFLSMQVFAIYWQRRTSISVG